LLLNLSPELDLLLDLPSKHSNPILILRYPASTIQILGAEKALFKAMKTKKNTPKYGIIYQSKIVSAANGRTKGKISRTLAAKCALCIRYDALGKSYRSKSYLIR
jgi:nucleolar protein 58